jgi:hypothetical protein
MTANSKPTVEQLCDSLLDAYRTKGLDVSASLQTPLSEQDIEAKASSAGLELPPELVQLYQWRNGAAGELGTTFAFAGKPFLSLETAMAQREAMLAALHPKDRADPSLEGLFPFAGNGDEWYALAKADADGHSPVLLVIEDAKPDFESFEAMLKTCVDWVGEPDWTPTSPPAKAMDIWYRRNPSQDL